MAWSSTFSISSSISPSSFSIVFLSRAIWFWIALYSSFFLTALSLTFRSSILAWTLWTVCSFFLSCTLASWSAFFEASSAALRLARAISRAARVFGPEVRRSRSALARWWSRCRSRRLAAVAGVGVVMVGSQGRGFGVRRRAAFATVAGSFSRSVSASSRSPGCRDGRRGTKKPPAARGGGRRLTVGVSRYSRGNPRVAGF